MLRLPFAACLSILLLAPAQAKDTHSWARYSNARYQYSICYPKDVLSAEPESNSGDGRRFEAKDGASLIVFGRNNVDGSTLKSTADETATSLAGPGGRVTFRTARGNWAVVSGENDAGIFYSKIFYNRRTQQFKLFEMTYESAQASLYNPIVSRLAACFVDGG